MERLGGETRTLTVLYSVTAAVCSVAGLFLNSFGLFADGAVSVMMLSVLLLGNGNKVAARALRIASLFLGAYSVLVGCFGVSALIGYADKATSIYVYPLFALLIIAKVAGVLFCEEGSSFRVNTVFSLACTILVLAGTLLLTAGHYFEPAVACAIGVYVVYDGVKSLFLKHDANEIEDTEEETSSEE